MIRPRRRVGPGLIAAGALVVVGLLLFLPRVTFPHRTDAIDCQIKLKDLHLLLREVTAPGEAATLQSLADARPDLSRSAFRCPSFPVPECPEGEDPGGYELVSWNPPGRRSIVAYDRTPCHDGKRNVLLQDGRVVLLDEELFQEHLALEAAEASSQRRPPKFRSGSR